MQIDFSNYLDQLYHTTKIKYDKWQKLNEAATGVGIRYKIVNVKHSALKYFNY